MFNTVGATVGELELKGRGGEVENSVRYMNGLRKEGILSQGVRVQLKRYLNGTEASTGRD